MKQNTINWDKVPDVITKEQFRQLCHIGKTTARYLLLSGKIPCVNTGKKTRCYEISKKDVMAYVAGREEWPEYYAASKGWYSKYADQAEILHLIPKINGDMHRYLYKFSPYKLVWNGDYYYVVGYSDKYDDIGSFRVDRISKVPEMLEEKAVSMPKAFDINTYLNSMFKMFNGERSEVELVCDNSVMDSIIDRFGESVKVYANDMESFRIIVKVSVSHIFFSWIFGFGGKVKIKAPLNVKEAYAQMVRHAATRIEE